MAFTTIRPKLTNQLSLEMTPDMYKPSEIFLTYISKIFFKKIFQKNFN